MSRKIQNSITLLKLVTTDPSDHEMLPSILTTMLGPEGGKLALSFPRIEECQRSWRPEDKTMRMAVQEAMARYTNLSSTLQ